MKLHTVFVTRNRLELTKQALATFYATVTVPYTHIVIDNASTDGTGAWLLEQKIPHYSFAENLYPGAACNFGWAHAGDATHLQRADNDFAFLPGWCEEVEARFAENESLGQLGLIPWEIERCENNVGGNNIIRRELWDDGLRYDETPWPQFPPGWTEDSFFSPKVVEMGWEFGRVHRQVIQDLSRPSTSDDYYVQSYGDRQIERLLPVRRR